MQHFRNTNQLRAFMKKEAERLGLSAANAYSTYLSRVLLEKLSKYNDGNILVKGSAAETTYLGKIVRGITDVDLAVLGPIEANIDLIKRFIDDETISDFKFKVVKTPRMTPTGIYKLSLETEFDKTRLSLGVDLQENYNRLIEKQHRKMPVIFEEDEPYSVMLPSFEEYLAEKLCIIAESNKQDVLNTRVKDFYDIYLLHGGKYDPEVLTKYFKEMLAKRGKIKLEDVDTEYLDEEFIEKHKELWEKAKKKYDFLNKRIGLYGAVYYARAALRGELQRNGAEMPDPIEPEKKVKLYK